MLSIDATRLLLGALLLLLGRRLFWLFVGAVGFVGGVHLAERLLPGRPEDVVIVFAIVVGLIAAVLAVVLRRLALGAAGFLAGGYLLMQLLAATVQASPDYHGSLAPWLLFLVGGLVGAVLMNLVFDWTLILLSAVGGAYLICMCIHGLNSQFMTAIFTALTLLGVLAQAGLIRRRERV